MAQRLIAETACAWGALYESTIQDEYSRSLRGFLGYAMLLVPWLIGFFHCFLGNKYMLTWSSLIVRCVVVTWCMIFVGSLLNKSIKEIVCIFSMQRLVAFPLFRKNTFRKKIVTANIYIVSLWIGKLHLLFSCFNSPKRHKKTSIKADPIRAGLRN
jgi:hypothetical protein